ncbi:YidB family protein [Kibdelosporangium aridum]|uniref:Uncharacterized protein n=1 Tax=Kibdelosporangium aridum TaxID=2030 RepID=A0A1Y5X1W2_KIBAR|nr:YidB family protein [Kibdelosporangium aridum]SMC65250.1 hypothetical protein SAMN05661093_01169 [Kibdelosporangium aridum]
MNGKLSTLLDDPEVRELIFAMASVTPPSGGSAAARLHAVLLHLAETTTKEQYGSWLSDGAVNKAITVEQVRMTIGDSAIDDLAQLMSASPGIVAWQLAAVLPDLVDAVSPGGAVVDADRLAREIAEASADDDRSAGSFGSRVH